MQADVISLRKTPLLQAKALTKVYGSLTALQDASLTLMPGEVRALIGANGAGKSTLIKILTGAVTPTSGTVSLDGQPLPLGRPEAMIHAGIACIYQHSNLAPAMTVLDNICLGRQPVRRFGLLDRPRQRREVTALLDRYGIDLDPDALVGTLPTVKQKEVEIAKALALDARVLLMDEPTGWLAAADVRRLHDTIRQLKARGVGVIYISHLLDEIFTICDSLTILRDGHVIAESAVAEITRVQVIEKMVGDRLARESAAAAQIPRHPRGTGQVRLSVQGLGLTATFRDVSFDLHAGEILCITGLIGSKRSEMVHALFGAAPHDSGRILMDGQPVAFRSPSQAIAAGIGLVPEDRHRDGLMLGMQVTDNLVMAMLNRFRRGIFLKRGAVADTSKTAIAALNIQPPKGDTLVGRLSGGNQQKVLVGKWLNLSPRILILDEPTVGVDVGAKAEIYAILRAERDRGAAVLVISSDLEEVMTIADRIGVMVAGRLVWVQDAAALTMADLVAGIGADA